MNPKVFDFFMEFEGVTVERHEDSRFIYRIDGEKVINITHLETWGGGTKTKYAKSDGYHMDVLKEAISHQTI